MISMQDSGVFPTPDEDAGERRAPDSAIPACVTDEDCSALDGPPMCTVLESIESPEGVCGNSGECEQSTIVHADCLAITHPEYPFCTGSADAGDLAYHFDPRSVCEAAGPRCGLTESSDDCDAPAPTCFSGTRTVSIATCESGAGCGVDASIAVCPDSPTLCEGMTLVTFEPACADGENCGDPTEVRTPCVAENTCVGTTFLTRQPTCNAESESCGADVTATQDCSSVDTCTITNLGAGCIVSFVVGECSSSGCSERSDNLFCAGGGCTCSPPSCR